MEASVLKFATLIAALMATSAFASTAEAHGGGAFFATFLAHVGQKQAHENWEESHVSRHVSHCKKKRELEEIQAEQAEEAAAQAAAARRASLLAKQKREAAKQAAAEAATVSTPKVIDAAPKSDQLPATPTATANITTASLKTTTSDQSTPSTNAGTASDVCRKYSPAADGLIDVPCK